MRVASRGLGLISESSYRFERGADWGMVEKAAHRALYLMQEYAEARIISDWAERSDPDHKHLRNPLTITKYFIDTYRPPSLRSSPSSLLRALL